MLQIVINIFFKVIKVELLLISFLVRRVNLVIFFSSSTITILFSFFWPVLVVQLLIKFWIFLAEEFRFKLRVVCVLGDLTALVGLGIFEVLTFFRIIGVFFITFINKFTLSFQFSFLKLLSLCLFSEFMALCCSLKLISLNHSVKVVALSLYKAASTTTSSIAFLSIFIGLKNLSSVFSWEAFDDLFLRICYVIRVNLRHKDLGVGRCIIVKRVLMMSKHHLKLHLFILIVCYFLLSHQLIYYRVFNY